MDIDLLEELLETKSHQYVWQDLPRELALRKAALELGEAAAHKLSAGDRFCLRAMLAGALSRLCSTQPATA